MSMYNNEHVSAHNYDEATNRDLCMQTLNPALRYVGTICLCCVLMYTVRDTDMNYETCQSLSVHSCQSLSVHRSNNVDIKDNSTPMRGWIKEKYWTINNLSPRS